MYKRGYHSSYHLPLVAIVTITAVWVIGGIKLFVWLKWCWLTLTRHHFLCGKVWHLMCHGYNCMQSTHKNDFLIKKMYNIISLLLITWKVMDLLFISSPDEWKVVKTMVVFHFVTRMWWASPSIATSPNHCRPLSPTYQTWQPDEGDRFLPQNKNPICTEDLWQKPSMLMSRSCVWQLLAIHNAHQCPQSILLA